MNFQVVLKILWWRKIYGAHGTAGRPKSDHVRHFKQQDLKYMCLMVSGQRLVTPVNEQEPSEQPTIIAAFTPNYPPKEV